MCWQVVEAAFATRYYSNRLEKEKIVTEPETSPQGPHRELELMETRGPRNVHKVPRPRSVTVLAVFQMLGGVMAVGQVLIGSEIASGAANSLGLFGQQHLTLAMLLGLMHFAAGIGMWTGKRWGWWLAAFSYLYAVMSDIGTVLLMPDLFTTVDEPIGGIGFAVARLFGAIIGAVLIFVYWFRETVLDYFDLLDLPKVKALAGLAGATVLALGAVYLAAGGAYRELDRIAEIYDSGDPASAAEELAQYLQSHPDNEMAWTMLGYVRRELYESEGAEAAFKQALELNARSAQAWNGLGLVAEEMGEGERAMASYENAVEIDPNYTAAHVNLSYQALQLYQDAKALEHAERAYELDNGDANVVINLAVVYHYHGNYEQRDALMAEADRLGYEGLEIVQLLFDGVWSVRE